MAGVDSNRTRKILDRLLELAFQGMRHTTISEQVRILGIRLQGRRAGENDFIQILLTPRGSGLRQIRYRSTEIQGNRFAELGNRALKRFDARLAESLFQNRRNLHRIDRFIFGE